MIQLFFFIAERGRFDDGSDVVEAGGRAAGFDAAHDAVAASAAVGAPGETAATGAAAATAGVPTDDHLQRLGGVTAGGARLGIDDDDAADDGGAAADDAVAATGGAPGAPAAGAAGAAAVQRLQRNVVALGRSTICRRRCACVECKCVCV